MVLVKTSAQYKFLQVLTATYVSLLGGFLSETCITNPSIFNDCTDPNNFVAIYDIPQLRYIVSDELVQYNPETFYYTEYESTSFWGYSGANFSNIALNVTNSAIAALTAACASNSTCTASYQATANAAGVVKALAQTNVNSIQYLLNKNPTMNWMPPYYSAGYLSSVYVATPFAAEEVYGVHDAVVRGISQGTINATTYIKQENLGLMLNNGGQIYESIVHMAAIGSYSNEFPIQSNINLTGTQFFTQYGIGNYELDARSSRPARDSQYRSHRLSREHAKRIRDTRYTTKWDVWAAEAAGVHIANKSSVFASIYAAARARPQRTNNVEERATCTLPDGGLQDGIAWLQNLTSYCSRSNYLSLALSPRTAMASALRPAAITGLPTQYASFVSSFADVLMGWIVTLCGLNLDGAPCYPGANLWKFTPAGGATIQSGTVVALYADVRNYATPTGPTLGSADLYCGLAPLALTLYQQGFSCCSSDCTGASCQTTVYGCVQGTGSC